MKQAIEETLKRIEEIVELKREMQVTLIESFGPRETGLLR